MKTVNATIRPGTKEDLPQILTLVQELAAFEKAPEEVTNSVDRMANEGFGDRPFFHAFVAELEGKIVGMAVYFFSYSTWKGKSLYLDDIVIADGFRRHGIGNALFSAVARVARDQQCGKMHWQVLDWNEPAIQYYKKVGAKFDSEWINCSLNAHQLNDF
jgi:GNAT superfamily N-acetyltransferase